MNTAPPADGREGDADIIGKMAAGCVDGLESLLRIHGPKVKGALRSLLGGHADDDAIEDAVHDAAMILFKRAKRLDAKQNLSGYMYITSRRELIRARKLAKPDKQLWEGAEQQIAASTMSSEPSSNGVTERVAQLLERLPRREKEILAFDRATDFSASGAEVARLLGTTSATVYALRNRTKERLAMLFPGLLAERPQANRRAQRSGGAA